jgi:hypothetical protein
MESNFLHWFLLDHQQLRVVQIPDGSAEDAMVPAARVNH